uniref:ETS domain-containing protein n=1 Tax=Cuerna arida TaxID=1464854 RepID=A0A1B6GA28_9HEMI
MPYQGMMPGYDDSESLELGGDWSIYKATSLLSDMVSFYDDSELFGQTGFDFSPVCCELPSKIVKTEPMTDLLPADVQHHGDWQYKTVEEWLSYDCLFWFIQQMQELRAGHYLTNAKMERFIHIDGAALKQMTEDDFTTVCPEYGMELFNRLQQKLKLNTSSSLYNNFYSLDNTPLPAIDHFSTFSPSEETHKLTDLDNETQLPPALPYLSSPETESSGYKSDSSLEPAVEPTPPPEKRRPGRPRGTRRKKKPEKLGRLWEFIRDLLLDSRYNPSLICWEDYKEGMFRFVHSDRVAKLWGSKKDNIDMNYEKLSRAMRYYYKSEVLLPVYGKRLVYKFGPKAMDGIRKNISNAEARSQSSSS